MPTCESYKKRIIAAMRDCGTYNRNLTMQIENLAFSLYVLSKCREDIEKPDFTITVMKETRDGEQPIENPILKTASRYQADVSRQMRQLKLTVEDIMGTPDVRDAADDMIDTVNAIK